MSERKVLNKYYPPDFDPNKIKRRRGINKDAQMTIRLMAPFSMRCQRCGDYIYKGKKFNARKETAVGEEYYGIKIFRFYIKCPACSSEITFKTDPKNADYICEQGATRNFENWSESDPGKAAGAMPDAAADDDYDSDGNPREEKLQRDAMADLERSQEQSRREMEMMDELADLRQRNARLEQSGVSADPEAVLAALHAERETAEQEQQRLAEQDEDDALVAQYFLKVPAGPPPPGASNGTNGVNGTKDKGKGKAKAVEPMGPPPVPTRSGVTNGENGEGADGSDDEGASGTDSDEDIALPSLTVKRAAPTNGTSSKPEPSVASLLAAKGKALDPPMANGNGVNGQAAAAKRKREDMMKKLGIKKKK